MEMVKLPSLNMAIMGDKMIRLANINDLDKIMEIRNEASALLKYHGINQWQDGYPNKNTFLNDINNKTLFVSVDEEVNGICSLSYLIDPSYNKIYGGKWLTNNSKYLVIHRLAVSKKMVNKGVATELIKFAINYANTNNLKSIRVDTHRDNKRMIYLLNKLGFKECGKIFLIDYVNIENLRTAFELVL